MQDWERFAPESLATKQPVAKFVVNRFAAAAGFAERFCHRSFDFGSCLSVEFSAVDRLAFGGEANIARQDFFALLVIGRWVHDWNDVQTEGLREFEVTFVVCRHGHDRAGAVTGQDIVGDPNRNRVSINRIDRVAASEHTGLAFVATVGAFAITLERSFFAVLFDFVGVVTGRQPRDHRVFGCYDHVSRTEQSVRPRRVNPQRRIACISGESRCGSLAFPSIQFGFAADVEIDFGTGAATDPILLQFLDPGRPLQIIQPVQQAFCVRRDSQHPLTQR